MDDLKGKMKEIQHYVEILKEQNKADENERNEQQAKNIESFFFSKLISTQIILFRF